MKRKLLFLVILLTALYITGPAPWPAKLSMESTVRAASDQITAGTLSVTSGDYKALNCPLEKTQVKAEISGFIARVNVTQVFVNNFADKIEAVYTFPLSQNSAVDSYKMTVGQKTIKGKIKTREEAKEIYQNARARGHVAALLDQQRPNIFTQSVANIMPDEKVEISISYVEILKFDEGAYEFVFPMVVGPRYNPGNAMGRQGNGFSFDTNHVPDASLITPQVVPENTRAGSNISIEVELDAGVPIEQINSPLHLIDFTQPSPSTAVVSLRRLDEIPNRDFILRYDVTGKKIESAILTHSTKDIGYFTLIMQPPEQVAAADVMPKELVFVLDTSGSMSGFPIEKAKETMRMAMEGLYPQDTFNLITFSGDTHILFPKPVPATPENLAQAQDFLASRAGSGGTEMMKAIKAALEPSDSQKHVRIVCFMTDGYVGNDLEIIAEIKRHPNARIFAFGIGNSVNRFLLDKMAEHGRGEVEYVTLAEQGEAAARRFHERVRNPLFTDISIDWGRLPVIDIYPQQIPDLFSAKPMVLTGRFIGWGADVIKIKGMMAGRKVVREMSIKLEPPQPKNRALAKLWARRKIDDLMGQDYEGIQRGTPNSQIRQAITQLGLEHGLMTQYTSFVAVQEKVFTGGGSPYRVDVPVEMPSGVSYQGIFGPAAPSNIKAIDIDRQVAANAYRSSGIGQLSSTYKQSNPGSTSASSLGAKAGNGQANRPQPVPDVIKRSEEEVRQQAIVMVKPQLSEQLRYANVTGSVVVELSIDENGEVSSTRVISGNQLLHRAAQEAAEYWLFKPTKIGAKPVKVTAPLTFKFNNNEESEEHEITYPKLHPTIPDLLQEYWQGQSLTQQKILVIIEDGYLAVQLKLKDRSDPSLEELKGLGIEVTYQSKYRNYVLAKVKLDYIELLATYPNVLFITPQINR